MILTNVENSNMYLFHCPACGHCHYINDTWTITGPEDKITVRPSIFVNRGRANPESHACHLYITDGKIQYLDDCTHEYAGSTVEMVDV
jgi:hypothetical protein